MKDEMTRTIVITAGATVGFIIGPIDGTLKALLIFMVIDYISGVLNAARQKKLNSDIGRTGLVKKTAIIFCVIVGHIVDFLVLGSESAPCRTMVIFFYLANEGLSILENLGALGIPIPDKLRGIIQDLKKEGE